VLSWGHSRRQILLHKNDDGSIGWETINFRLGDKLPWRAEIDIYLCSGHNCFKTDENGEHVVNSDEELAALNNVVKQIRSQLATMVRNHALERIAKGAPIFRETELGAHCKGKVGLTRIGELIEADRFPASVAYSGRKVWLREEVEAALVKLGNDDTDAIADKPTPLNRYERISTDAKMRRHVHKVANR
jgi:hypothetical protein